MNRRLKTISVIAIVVIALNLMIETTTATARELSEWFSIGGVVSGANQCQKLAQMEQQNTCRGALAFQPEISIKPSGPHELFVKFGFAAGNGLNLISPFVQVPWAADLEFDVKDINGSDRDYLLTSWYKYTINFGGEGSISLTGGIIDSTEHLNKNAFANDEFTQFMNDVFVNDPEKILPSYDAGAALELEMPGLAVRTVIMRVSESEDGERYNYYGVELTATDRSELGKGNYRFLLAGTDQRFLNTSRTAREKLLSFALSFDQEVGEALGLFARLGWQNDEAAVDYSALYSAGLDIKGDVWGQAGDNIGIGYAYLVDGNADRARTHVGEVYYRYVIREDFSVTGDVQYMKDEIVGAEVRSGFIFGIRATAEF